MDREEKTPHSEAARRGADHLLERIENGEMSMEVLPKYFTQFTGTLEAKDYISYCRFLHSENGRKVIHLLEELDGSELFEL